MSSFHPVGQSLLLPYSWQAVINDCFRPPKITPERHATLGHSAATVFIIRESGKVVKNDLGSLFAKHPIIL